MSDHRLVIGTPAVERPSWAFVASLLNLKIPFDWLFKHQHGYGGVDGALNSAIDWTLNHTNAEWFVIMASDAVVHPQCITRLLSWNVKCVAALSFMRYAPVMPTVYISRNEDGYWRSEVEIVRAWIRQHPQLMALGRSTLLEDRPNDGLLAVRRFGTHVTLLHRDVLEVTGPPWFERQSTDGSGEDFHFVEKVEDAGFQPYVDMTQVAGHEWGTWPIGALDFMAWEKHVKWETGEILIDVDAEVENGKVV